MNQKLLVVSFAVKNPVLFTRLITGRVISTLRGISSWDCYRFETFDRVWRGVRITLAGVTKEEKEMIKGLVYSLACKREYYLKNLEMDASFELDRLRMLLKSCRLIDHEVGNVPLFRRYSHKL